MTTGNTSLLGLALPVDGELDGTWGDVVNDSITSLVDSAVAGTTTLSADADVTLTDTVLAANQSRQAIILWTASNGATTRNITAPARSKAYIVINAGTGSIVLRGAGPTTGITVVSGEKCVAAWNGSDFVKVSSSVVAAILLGTTDSASPFETSLGYEAGLNTTGVRNTFVGYRSGKANIGGADNSSIGYQTLSNNTTGDANTAFGSNAATACTTGSRNTVFGASAQSGTTGSFNSVFGWGGMNQASTAYENSAFGYNAFNQATTGYRNVSFGYGAMEFSDTANNNVAVGHSAGAGISSGAQNVVIGALAAYTGSNNLNSGSNNIIIGYNAEPTSSAVSNQITLGNSSISTLRCQVTTITSLSDARDKTNITDLTAGLNLINAVRPVAFDWNMRDGGKVGEHDTGFIAQDLQAAQAAVGVKIPGLVFEAGPERLEAGYGKLLPVMVKAIQELSAKVDALQAEINTLKGQ